MVCDFFAVFVSLNGKREKEVDSKTEISRLGIIYFLEQRERDT